MKFLIPFYSHGIVPAPMAGITDSAFRRICKRFGATSTVTEMISAAGISYRSVKTNRFLKFTPEEKPIGVQLFGGKPEFFAAAADIVTQMGFDFIDLNAGCPVKKVTSNGSGASLLKNIPNMLKIITTIRSNTTLPITVKMRLGWSPENQIPFSLANNLYDLGVSAITLHGRFRSDMFSGDVRKTDMKEFIERSPLPVLANGDSRTPDAIRSLQEKTGATGMMLGRGIKGRPWLFRSLVSDSNDVLPRPDELYTTIMDNLNMMKEYISYTHVYSIFRGCLLGYLHGFRGAAELRQLAVTVSTDYEIKEIAKRADEAIQRSRIE